VRAIVNFIAGLAPGRGWFAFALAVFAGEIALRALHEQRIWAHEGFPWHARLMLATSSALAVIAATWPLHWTACLVGACRARGPAIDAGAGVLAAGALFTGLFTYAASWLAMWRLGIFADGNAIYFAARNLKMLLHYVAQAEPAIGRGLASAVLVCAGLSYFIVRLGRRANLQNLEHLPWRLADGCLAIALAASTSAGAAVFYGDGPDSAERVKEWWNQTRPGRSFAIAYRLNPIVTAAAGQFIVGDEDRAVELLPGELGPLRAARPDRATEAPPKLSLILIEVESLRQDVLFLKHQGREVTPALNRLAAGGLNFTRAYAASTHSNYADPALLSSLYPLRVRRHHYYSVADPWPKALVYDVAKQHGCATAVISSQNETWGGMDAFLKSPNLDLLFDSRSSDGPKYVADSDVTFARYAAATHSAGKLDDRHTVARAIDWLGECQQSGRPFCLSVNLQSSHFPYVLLSDTPRPFAPAKLDFFASFVSYPLDKVPIVKNAWYNALSYIDKQLQALVDFLDKSGLRETTLLVVVGDNGECFYENGYSTHAGPPFEPAIHVPLVMNCPGAIEPREEDYLTQAIDVVPTALALMGLPPSPCFQGANVLAADRMPAERRIALVHNHTLVRATADAIVTAAGWKYVYDRKTKNGELFDLRIDPGEQNPVQAKHSAVAQTLDRILQRWRSVQLAYYARPDYYGIYYPPPPPRLSDADLAIVERD